jgi:uncharacterized protein
MPVEVKPLGEACNLACTYCYQEGVREAGNAFVKVNMDAIMEQLEYINRPFHLFGGEALLNTDETLETLWKYGLEKFGENGVQTNGTILTDKHIELMKKYKVGVGVSIDGPNELNRLREVRKARGNEEETLKSTETIINNIRRLKENRIGVAVIITLHRMNATEKYLPRLLNFIRYLGDIGVRSGNIHVLEVDKTMPDQQKYELTQEENIHAMLTIAKFLEENPDLRWNPFYEVQDVLQGKDDEANCYWRNCDNLNTQAVYGIEGDGSLSNCGRTSKDGVRWYKADDTAYYRYIALYNTPQDKGGCQGCRFWITCGGSCVGEAMDNDFRNKTIHCKTQKALQTFYEEKLVEKGKYPITLSPLRFQIEQIMINKMIHRRSPSVSRIIEQLKENPIMYNVEVKEGKE